ncbi:MAG: TonB-dependent receptor [Hyphomicrobiaceae bacterium]
MTSSHRSKRHLLCGAGIAALLVGGTAATGASAQDGTTLAPIIVESADLGLTPVPVEKLGSSVTVVTRDELEARQVKHLAEALRTVPGLAVSRTSTPGSVTQIRVRGAEANHVLVLIDGVEINSTTDGEFDFSDLLVDDIERIEVVRGPQSGLWGANALSGLINIVTRRGDGPARVHASAEAGSFNTRSVSLGVSGGGEHAWGSISGAGLESDGFNISDNGTEDDGARIVNFQARGGLKLHPWLTAEGFVRDMDKRADFDSFGAAPGALPGDLAVSVDQAGLETLSNTLAAGGSLVVDPFDGMWRTRLFANYSETDRENVDPVFGNSSNLGQRERYGVSSTLTLETPDQQMRHIVTGLVEQEDERFEISSDPLERGREKSSVAGEIRGEYFDQLFLSGAIRHDDSDAFGAFDTYRVAAAWLLPQTETRFHGSYGTGVVFPTMFEQFGVIPGFFTPNPALLPEESVGWDAGVEQTFLDGRVVVDVTYFEQDLTHEIFSTFFGPPVNLIGKSERKGVEVSATLRPTDTLDLIVTYTHLDASDSTGLAEVRRPEHAASLSANWRFDEGRGLLSAGVVYNGEMRDVGFDAFTFAQRDVLLDAYTVVNLGARYAVTDQIDVYGRLENAFDADYEESFGFNTAGFAAYGGIKFRFEEPETAVAETLK